MMTAWAVKWALVVVAVVVLMVWHTYRSGGASIGGNVSIAL